MCKTDLGTDTPPPLFKYQRLAREKGGKIYFWKKKKSELGKGLTHPCVIIYFQCRVPGISALECGVEIEFFLLCFGDRCFLVKPTDLSVIEGAFKWNNCKQRRERKTGSSERNSWFHQPLLLSCLSQSPLSICLCFSLTLPFVLTDSPSHMLLLEHCSATSFLTSSFCMALQHVYKPFEQACFPVWCDSGSCCLKL